MLMHIPFFFFFVFLDFILFLDQLEPYRHLRSSILFFVNDSLVLFLTKWEREREKALVNANQLISLLTDEQKGDWSKRRAQMVRVNVKKTVHLPPSRCSTFDRRSNEVNVYVNNSALPDQERFSVVVIDVKISSREIHSRSFNPWFRASNRCDKSSRWNHQLFLPILFI